MSLPPDALLERRRSARRQVHLTMVIDGFLTRTVDVSTCGIRFESLAAIPPGTPISFALLLADADCEVRMECEGTVVRVVRGEETSHVAATIESIAFQPGTPGSSFLTAPPEKREDQ